MPQSSRHEATESNLISKFQTANINALLYTLIGLLLICLFATLFSRSIMNKSLEQQKMTEHLMFEITYGHNFIVRDVDVSMRGFGIIHDERYLYRSNEYIRIDLENNFKRLDSLLHNQGYADENGIKAIEKYKHYIRSFVDYHRKMIQLVRDGGYQAFVAEFSRDSSATMWPVFTRAVEEVAKHERSLAKKALSRYNFFSLAVVYIQGFTLILSIPLVTLVLARLRNERKTARILEERKLIDERNKVKENMLSVMSHEIRTPLNSMIGLTHVLKRRSPRKDQVEIIDTLKTSGDHLLHLVNDILDYNKIQANRLDLEILSFNLIETLRQVHGMFARFAEEKGLAFNVQMSTKLPSTVKGDASRLLQILSNLVSNAIKFTSEGSVTLYVRQTNEGSPCEIEFKVEDTGIGIPSDKLSHLYEPFTQMGAQTHRKYGGSGLGLLIVKNLVEAMKGKVDVISVPGEATTVTVTIPFAVDDEVHNSNVTPSHTRLDVLRGTRVLYVEDVESNQFVLTALLEDYQVDCVIAKDGNEALLRVAEDRFDVILLDVQLPDIGGYEVAMAVRNGRYSKNRETPIILFSADTGITEEKIRNCGANDYVGKPFLPGELILKIEKNIAAQKKIFTAPGEGDKSVPGIL